ncbi:sugar phosphate isomerase/epimerase [Roseibium hamelinense]|uniref:Sugar phosphate isomerase/epimerase n=1 Tax=Roseibium hamelinense TaxID=150831 RepID=A0A562SLI0_9HYPH|nr:sugar phosphate isomerase/epimerase family protein [Roseibium hamelinense]MTI42254.1 sugar phosphate isomerase/epimerase [Roseibium hamelinense]TWI82149.1 sugar phosphate isomerase/epimerase [Roseibium hamelinense]
MTDLPVLGAALSINGFKVHRELMLARPRDLELQDFISADLLNGNWQESVDTALKLLDGHEGRRGIHGPFWGFTLDAMDPEVRSIVKKRLLQGLDVCERLGGTHMVVHSPFSTWDYNNLDNYDRGRERKIELCQETMGPAVKRAEDIGCELVIENIEDKDPNDRLRLAQSFGSTAVKVSIDTGHAHYAHGSTGAPPVDYYVKAAGDMLAHVHLQDADGYADRHWALGEGTINWPSVFEALSKIGSKPRLIIELRDHNGVPESIAKMAALGLAQ